MEYCVELLSIGSVKVVPFSSYVKAPLISKLKIFTPIKLLHFSVGFN